MLVLGDFNLRRNGRRQARSIAPTTNAIALRGGNRGGRHMLNQGARTRARGNALDLSFTTSPKRDVSRGVLTPLTRMGHFPIKIAVGAKKR